ncbi:MAG: hypothetical protein E7329_10345 [Clostridiales bacterium]|nr:hypothetical protein [Clostridiales bacterium]
MQKKVFLAILLAASLLLSGCALVTVDQEADNARIIIDVNGETVTKAEVNSAIDYQISQNEYMNELYAMFGMTANLTTDRATLQEQVIESYVRSLVAEQKAIALGLDQMTEEETAEINASAEENYKAFLEQVASYYLSTSTAEGDALLAEAEKYVQDNNLGSKEDFVLTATETKLIEKLENETVKDVTVSEEELTAALNEKVEADRATYTATPTQYGTDVNGGLDAYYAPAGYRYVKHILVEFTEEDNTAITDTTAAYNAAETALTEAQAALDNAAADADKAALQTALDEAKKARDEALAAAENATATAYANIKEKVDAIYAAATAEGADFDALVAEHSTDAGMPAIGYAICEGFTDFVESFTAAGMALEKVGDVSAPVESTYGYHILQYSADIEEGAATLDAVRETLEEETLSTKQTETYTAAVDAWVAEAKVTTYLDRMN